MDHNGGMGIARRRHPLVGLLVVLTVVTAAGTATAARAAGPAAPNDPLFAKQWGLSVIGAPQAWATSAGAGVLIGIVDTGVDLSHQDLSGQVVASTDCVGSGGNPLACRRTAQDDNGHGTEVAGIAAATTNNALGIAGVAPGAKLLVAKALDRSGKASVEDVNAAIEWLVDHGAQVVNLSLGDPTFSFTSLFGATLRQGIEYAWSEGAIPVLGAGNATALGLPAGYPADLDAVVVGATTRDGTFSASTTPTGDAKWAVMAPGGSADGVQADDVVSTNWVAGQPNSYGYLSGTTMAAPVVSGVLALLLADGLGPQEAVNRLLATAVSPVACGGSSATCKGIVDAAEAMNGLPAAPPPATSTFAPVLGPAHSPPPTTSAPVVVAPRPPLTPPVSAAAPAVMRPAPTTTRPTPPTTRVAAAAGPSTPAAAAPPTPVAVGLAAVNTHHGPATDVTWFVVLAGFFALLVSVGIIRVMRAPPPEGME
jgi:serine protease